MASQDQFLKKMLGYHDITVNGGSKLPRRNLINIIGGKTEDVNNATQVSITLEPVWNDPSTVIASSQNNLAPIDFAILTDVAINPTGGSRKITGWDAVGLRVFNKRIWNLTADASPITLQHDNSLSLLTNRMTTSDGLTLTLMAGEAALMVRNNNGIGWRVIKCPS